MRYRNMVLPDQDLARLKEISEAGTLEGSGDQQAIVRYLASALLVVAEGQIDASKNLKSILKDTGLGE